MEQINRQEEGLRDHREDLRIHSIESFGTHDGPGIRFIVFVQGCGFRCLYCHNPDTLDPRGGKWMGFDEIVRRTLSEKPYFADKGGITISGGEPLLQAEKLGRLFARLKEHGIHTTIDTNGGGLNENVKNLLSLTDLVLLDVKHIDPEKHRALTGTDNRFTLEFARYLHRIEKPVWLRYVFVPGWSDDLSDLERWGDHFKDYPNVERVEILPYHKLGVNKWEAMGLDYKLKEVEPPTRESLEKARDIFKKYFKEVRIN